jgi:hypothetical protein
MHPKLIEIITTDVSNMFNLDEGSLFELKVEYGEKFLNAHYADQPDVAAALKQHSQFWGWWCELWAQRDRILMQRCERKTYGLNYTYLLNGYVGQQRMQETKRVFTENMWEFYEDFHYWRQVKFYPNEVMVKQCRENHTELSTIKQ